MNENGIHGISLCITSADYSPIHLQKEILAFLDNFKLTPKIFEDYCRGLVTTKKDGHQSQDLEAEYLAQQMIKFSTSSYKEIEWDNLEQEIDYLEKLTYTEFIEFFQETLLRPNVNRQSRLR